MPTASAITEVLDSIVDPESEQQLAMLDGALMAIPAAVDAEACIPALLRIFERFPWSDGFETFWGVLHALEHLPGYESLLVASVRHSPGEFNLVMLNRLLNGGILEIDRVPLLLLLEEVASASQYSERARTRARSFLEYQARARRPG